MLSLGLCYILKSSQLLFDTGATVKKLMVREVTHLVNDQSRIQSQAYSTPKPLPSTGKDTGLPLPTPSSTVSLPSAPFPEVKLRV